MDPHPHDLLRLDPGAFGLPDDAPAKLQTELELALATEDYERAAELRDRLARQRDCRTGV